MAPVETVYLVSCVKGKQTSAAAAKDLYTSDWFRKARAYVEPTGMPWFILSAEYGLLHPDQRIAPYEKTLNKMRSWERKRWAKKVIHQMEHKLPKAEQIVVLAGVKYREHLITYLRDKAPSVKVPLKGLPFGKQKRWFNEQAGHGSA